MPIFEFRCSDCNTNFEELVRSANPVISCPSCGSEKAEKQLSVFAAAGGDSAPSACDRPGCNSGFS